MPVVSYVDPETGQTKEKKFSYDPEGQHAAQAFATEVQGRIVDVSRRDPKSTSY
jgi:hypothetical protein